MYGHILCNYTVYVYYIIVNENYKEQRQFLIKVVHIISIIWSSFLRFKIELQFLYQINIWAMFEFGSTLWRVYGSKKENILAEVIYAYGR